MIKLVYRTPGTSPASLQLEGSDKPVIPTITLCKYNASSLEESTFKDAASALKELDISKNNWIDVNGRADINTVRLLGEHFGLSPLIIADILTSQRPKMEHMDDGIFLITTMAYNDQKEPRVVEIEQLSLFFGNNYVVTFQQEPGRDSF